MYLLKMVQYDDTQHHKVYGFVNIEKEDLLDLQVAQEHKQYFFSYCYFTITSPGIKIGELYSPRINLGKEAAKSRNAIFYGIISLMPIKKKIARATAEALAGLGVNNPEFSLALTTDLDHGDYTTNAALAYAKELKSNPRDLAEKIKEGLVLPAEVDRVEVAGAGFLNFFLTQAVLSENLDRILAGGDDYGRSSANRAQEIILEYTNTNVLKPFHIGHLLGNVIGESMARLFEAGGMTVRRVTYQGDTGLHIAKAVWGLIAAGGKKDGSPAEQINYLGQAYAAGATAYEQDPNAQTEIKEINQKIFAASDQKITALYQWGRQISLDHFESLYQKLGTKFDHYFFESEVASEAVRLIKDFAAQGVFTASDGAWVFHGEQYDPSLHTRVFLTAQEIPTYEAKDIAHAIRKDRIYPEAERSVIITANEQSGYFKVVLRALAEVDQTVAAKTEHWSHGMLRLPTGKMSSRTGDVISAESLIETVEKMVNEKMKNFDGSASARAEVARQVAIGAIKYSILKQDTAKDIIFDLEKSISFEGDSGPYLQYTYVRIKSILTKAGRPSSVPADRVEAGKLERMLWRYPEIVRRADLEKAPHQLCVYLFELAGEFSSYYAQERIIGNANEDYRLALVAGVGQVLKNGLYLLGMETPVKM